MRQDALDRPQGDKRPLSYGEVPTDLAVSLERLAFGLRAYNAAAYYGNVKRQATVPKAQRSSGGQPPPT